MLALVVNRPDVLVNVTFLFRPAPAGEIVIRGKFRPDSLRRHGQLAGPERLAKRFQRLRAGIFAHLSERDCPIWLAARSISY